jgi:hypothetical protein
MRHDDPVELPRMTYAQEMEVERQTSASFSSGILLGTLATLIVGGISVLVVRSVTTKK